MTFYTVDLSVGEVETIAGRHRKLYEHICSYLARGTAKRLQKEKGAAGLIGLIIDVDDEVWRKYFSADKRLPKPNPKHDLKETRVFQVVVPREKAARIFAILSVYADFLNSPIPLGCMHVLVLSEGTASPFVLHWAEELSLEWGK